LPDDGSDLPHVLRQPRRPRHVGFLGAGARLRRGSRRPNEPGHEECLISSTDGSQRLLFIQVPDAKQVKNRLHLDLKPAESTREQELERLSGLGAREVADRRRPDGSGWVVLADPEGNEFCILRSDAERAASA